MANKQPQPQLVTAGGLYTVKVRGKKPLMVTLPGSVLTHAARVAAAKNDGVTLSGAPRKPRAGPGPMTEARKEHLQFGRYWKEKTGQPWPKGTPVSQDAVNEWRKWKADQAQAGAGNQIRADAGGVVLISSVVDYLHSHGKSATSQFIKDVKARIQSGSSLGVIQSYVNQVMGQLPAFVPGQRGRRLTEAEKQQRKAQREAQKAAADANVRQVVIPPKGKGARALRNFMQPGFRPNLPDEME